MSLRRPISPRRCVGSAWGQTEFQVNLKLGLTPLAIDPTGYHPLAITYLAHNVHGPSATCLLRLDFRSPCNEGNAPCLCTNCRASRRTPPTPCTCCIDQTLAQALPSLLVLKKRSTKKGFDINTSGPTPLYLAGVIIVKWPRKEIRCRFIFSGKNDERYRISRHETSVREYLYC